MHSKTNEPVSANLLKKLKGTIGVILDRMDTFQMAGKEPTKYTPY